MKVGVHTSIAGGLENAVHHAKKIGCDGLCRVTVRRAGYE